MSAPPINAAIAAGLEGRRGCVVVGTIEQAREVLVDAVMTGASANMSRLIARWPNRGVLTVCTAANAATFLRGLEFDVIWPPEWGADRLRPKATTRRYRRKGGAE